MVKDNKGQVGKQTHVTLARSIKKRGFNTSKLIFHILNGKNNTIITVTDLLGNKLFQGSCGSMGYKGCKKKATHALHVLVKHIRDVVSEINPTGIEIRLRVNSGSRHVPFERDKGGAMDILIGNKIPVFALKEVSSMEIGVRRRKSRAPRG